MNSIMRVLGVIAIPLGWFNFLGSIVAGIWLAVLGKWGLIAWGIASMFVSAYGLSLVMMLAVIFAVPGGYLFNRGMKALASPFVILAVLYNTAVITVWCGWVLAFFARRADAASLIPALLWSFSMATGPFAYMASKEDRDNVAAIMTSYFAQVSYVVMMIAVFAGVRLLDAMYVFAIVMLVGSALQFMLTLQQERERKAIAEEVA